MVQAVNPEEVKTGTKFHPNNQVKADHPKRPSPFGYLLKDYRYQGGEITKWFVEAWDHFSSFEDACAFMKDQIKQQKYRQYCFSSDWPAILDRFLAIRERLTNPAVEEGQDPERLSRAKKDQVGKVFVKTAASSSDINDKFFQFTNQFVMAASANLNAAVIKVACNHLKYLTKEEVMLYTATPAHKAIAKDETLPIMHPECILEWVDALQLEVSADQFKTYCRTMIDDGDIVGAAIIISRYGFQSDFDIPDLITRLVEDQNRYDVCKALVKPSDELKKMLIDVLLSLRNVKGAVKAVKDFGMNPSMFPRLVEMASFNSANYFVSCCFRAPSHPDHNPLSKVEDLFSGDTTLTICLLTLLLKTWNKKHRANPQEPLLQKILGIIKRNNIDMSQQSAELQTLFTGAEGVTYNAKQDPRVVDQFGPINTKALRMPSSVELHFIGTEADIALLDRLVGKPMIGMDSEWRPTVRPFSEQKLAIFQLSSDTDAYIIDLVALKNNPILDAKLTEIFTDERTISIGFAFGSDTSMFKESLPGMNFFKRFARFLDVQAYWQAIKKEKNQIGLAKVVETILGKPLCKGEQMSNWELRPLRQSQRHYGALDAVCLIDITVKMTELAKKEDHADEVTVEKHIKPLIFGQKPEVVESTGEKKDNKKNRKRKRGSRKKKGAREAAQASETADTAPQSDTDDEEEKKAN